MRSRRLLFKSKGEKEQKVANGSKSEPEILTLSTSSSEGEVDRKIETQIEEEKAKSPNAAHGPTNKKPKHGKQENLRKQKNGVSNQPADKPKKDKRKTEQNGDDDGGQKKSGKKEEKGLSNSFPMYRVSRIIKADAPDLRITQEAVFLIRVASEKFLELFCEDAHACSVLDRKSHVSYQNLSSVVCKRRRLDFLSDFIPEKIKAEDALAEVKEGER